MKNNPREAIFLKVSFYVSFLFLVLSLLVLVRFLSTIHLEIKTADQRPQPTKIIRVIDGDTVVTESNQKIRLIGIDTPEINTDNPKKCLGQIAAAKMKELVEDKYVTLEKDVSDTDKYNRLLRYIWLDGKLINETLVSEGYAQIDIVNPDIKYKQVFSDAQVQAKNHSLGLWNEFNCARLSKQN